jgi:signal transduction histidine kinase
VKLNFNSLKLRLFMLAALWIGLALGLSWMTLALLFERHTERQITAELIGYGETLAGTTSLDNAGKPFVSAPLSNPRFLRPASGLYWHISAPAGTLASRSLWDGAWSQWPNSTPSQWQVGTTKGPFEPRMIRVTRTIRPTAGGPGLLVEIGLDHQVIIDARSDFAVELGGFLALLWAVLTLASVFQVTQGLKPLNGLRQRIGELRADAKVRMDVSDLPSEVAPLIQAINALADARAGDTQRARDRARDLAHTLKTPLTALKMQVDDLSDVEAKTALGESISVLNIAVQAELARATASPDFHSVCNLSPIIERLTGVVGRTPLGACLAFTNHVPFDTKIPLSEDAAFEVFGALLDNATRHARTQILIAATQSGTDLRVLIEDDGAGLNVAQYEVAVTRGIRLDQATGTQGLGLAIVRDIIHASGGTLSFAPASLGGLGVTICWPLNATN